MSGNGEPGSESGSDTAQQSASEQAVAMLQQNQQAPGTAESQQGQSNTQQSQSSQPSGDQQPTTSQQEQTIGSDFLKGVPEEHKALLEPYVKQWDAGVTRRFQELQSQYAPYRGILDQGVPPTDLNNALQIYQLLDTNPQYLYQLLKSELEPDTGAGDQGQGLQGGEEEFELPAAYQQRLDQMQAVLEALAQRELSNVQSQRQQQEDAQLDEYLGLLKTEKGDFDEEYVLARMMKGMSGPDAVDAWNTMIQTRLNGAGQGQNAPPVPGANTPPILSGGGTVPVDSKNIGAAKDKDVKSLVAQMLENAQANNT